MASPNPDDLLLLIRCPSCGQRFKVGEDLRDRTVECGGCESRFKINEDVIVRGRKVYPGERKALEFNNYQRVPLPSGEKMIGVQPIQYSRQPDPAVLEPVSPQRIMAGGVGVAAMVVMAMLLMFGGHSGGLLDEMPMVARLVMAAFACVLGVSLLVYANPKARPKAGLIGLLMAAGVMALPWFFKTGTPIIQHPVEPLVVPGPVAEVKAAIPGESADLTALREQIGTAPLESEIKRLENAKSEKHAIGLWLREMDESNRYVMMDYIVRVSGADLSSHFYPRERGEFLFVVTGITASLRELSDMAAALGDIAHVFPELSIIEVRVRNENFLEGPIEKLTNKADPAFYELNKRELESIDLSRMKRAVQRLAGAEPKVYRTDISRKLLALLGQSGVDFKIEICNALTVWSDQPGVAGEAALKEVKKLEAAGKPIPVEMIAVVVKEKNAGVIPVIDKLWFKNPSIWESLYGDMGPVAEKSVLARFPETEGTMRYSAARLLGRVGGSGSLPVLQGAESGADSELKAILGQSRKEILGRMGTSSE